MGVESPSTNGEVVDPFWITRGIHLEAHISRLFEYLSGRIVEKRERCHHSQHYFLRCTADRYILAVHGAEPDDGILEIKSLGPWTFRQTVTEGVAPEYYAQLQHYLFVAQKRWGHFAIQNAEFAWILLLPEEEWSRPEIHAEIERSLLIPRVEWDEEWLSYAIPRLLAWWEEYIERGVRPPVAETERERVWPAARVGAQALDWRDNAEWNRSVLALKEAREQLSLAKYANEMAENTVKALMGENEVILSAYGKMSFKEQSQKRFDYKTFLEEHPEFDVPEHYSTTTNRVFRPTFNEG